MSKERDRLSRDDWAEAALRALPAVGVRGLAVERLARSLGVTKGSFYWHFRSRRALVDAALDLWERMATDQVIGRLDTADHAPGERLVALMREALDSEGVPIERALLAAATTDPTVGAVYARVSRRRLAYVQRLFAELGHDDATSRDAAASLYAEFVGLLQLAPLHPELLSPEAIERRARRAASAHSA